MRTATVFALLAVSSFAASAHAQSFKGISIGDNIEKAHALGKPSAQEAGDYNSSMKWDLSDKNDLSITYQNSSKRIVYMEYDWGGDRSVSGRSSGIADLIFGYTNLDVLRDHLASNGFVYKDHNVAETPDGGVEMFNCYEIKSSSHPTFCAISAISKDRAEQLNFNRTKIAGIARLDALILANPAYLDALWGKDKLYDPEYRPVAWGSEADSEAQKQAHAKEIVEISRQCANKETVNQVVSMYGQQTEKSADLGRLLKFYDISLNNAGMMYQIFGEYHSNLAHYLERKAQQEGESGDQCKAKLITDSGDRYVTYGWRVIDGSTFVSLHVYLKMPEFWDLPDNSDSFIAMQKVIQQQQSHLPVLYQEGSQPSPSTKLEQP